MFFQGGRRGLFFFNGGILPGILRRTSLASKFV
jgi:hypothetical protein